MQTPNSDKTWQTTCPCKTFVYNISRHLEFTIEQGHRVIWVSGSQLHGDPVRVWCSGGVGVVVDDEDDDEQNGNEDADENAGDRDGD